MIGHSFKWAAAALCVCAGAMSIWTAFSAGTEEAAVFISPARQDLGKLKQLQATQAETLLVNNTKRTIRIESIEATCGCTKPRAENDVIPPASSTTVRAEIQTGYRRGEFSSLVTINYKCDDTETKGRLAWSIRADVETEYSIRPELLLFTRNSVGFHQQIYIQSRTVPNFTLSGVTCSHNCFRTSCTRDASPGNWKIDVQFVPGSAMFPAGRHWLTVSTNALVQPELMIPINVVDIVVGGESAKPTIDRPAGSAS